MTGFAALVLLAAAARYSLVSPLPRLDGNEQSTLTLKTDGGETKPLKFPAGAGVFLERPEYLIVSYYGAIYGAVPTTELDRVDFKDGRISPVIDDVVYFVDGAPDGVLVAVRLTGKQDSHYGKRGKELFAMRFSPAASAKDKKVLATGAWLPDRNDEDLGVQKNVREARERAVYFKGNKLFIHQPGKKEQQLTLP